MLETLGDTMLVKRGVAEEDSKILKTKEVKQKMKTLKRVGSIAAGAVMLGAAVSGAVSAGMDSTGLTKDFFYDAGYNPVIQIVLGEKGMATDAVAGGNIAAVIGNLAYTSAEATVDGGSASGAVVLGISARGATGKFEQSYNPTSGNTRLIKVNRDSDTTYDFYNDNEGLYFNQSAGGAIKGTDGIETYTRGEFVSYSLACDQQERTEAGILKKGTYNNIHCLFCQTLCLSALENPEHELEESISIDFNKIKYFEDGLGKDDAEALVLKIESKAVTYILDAGFIPMNKIIENGTSDTIDFEWRGQFILFGEEYYVKDISGTDKIYLAKGKILDDISSEGYTSEYMGYKFKIDHLIYSAEYEVAGILLDVEKPDGTVVQTQISKMANGIVDDIEIAGVYAEEADAVATASIIVYDTTTNVLLEDGKDLELGGEVKKYWKVNMVSVQANGAAVDVSEYDTATDAGKVLSNVTVQYRHSIELGVGEALEFPTTYKVMWDGFRTNDYTESPCSGAGEGDIKIEREGKYRGLVSFTGDDGQRYNGVYIDQGPYSEGDMFVIDGGLYEYDDANELTTDTTVMKVTLKDLLNGGKKTYDLDAIGSATSFTMYTYAFEESTDNDAEIVVEPDSERNDSDVYIGAGPAAYLLYDGGDLYAVVDNDSTALTYSNAVALLEGETIGINQNIFSPSNSLQKFEMDDGKLYMTVVNENNTYDLNDDRDSDGTDRLIQLQNGEDEYLIVDFYDRDFNDSEDTYFSENVLTSGNALDVTAALTDPSSGPSATTDYGYKWQDEEDTVAITPEGGLVATIDYGGSREVEAVTACVPQDIVYATIFIGTSEQATTIDTTITKEDEGTEKTVGCCTYLIKEFGVSTSGVSAESVMVNPIVGNLVVPEIAADTTKNLIVVGGPAVNGLCGLTKDEIQAASGQYVVKKDGNKVYVAGWTAADTVDGGNALIAWLQDNVH
ncbi:MAG: S-layer protein [Candidatus Altiarchaeales archaeon]|nr:S-layer protein [Candidatus Altiarchaeales archaeon]MBD3416966.1 S-layer protein [Candidatus Altiarchaeales archaeon]